MALHGSALPLTASALLIVLACMLSGSMVASQATCSPACQSGSICSANITTGISYCASTTGASSGAATPSPPTSPPPASSPPAVAPAASPPAAAASSSSPCNPQCYNGGRCAIDALTLLGTCTCDGTGFTGLYCNVTGSALAMPPTSPTTPTTPSPPATATGGSPPPAATPPTAAATPPSASTGNLICLNGGSSIIYALTNQRACDCSGTGFSGPTCAASGTTASPPGTATSTTSTPSPPPTAVAPSTGSATPTTPAVGYSSLTNFSAAAPYGGSAFHGVCNPPCKNGGRCSTSAVTDKSSCLCDGTGFSGNDCSISASG